MNTREKLQFIQRLSGKTQEALALELGVSFVTFNSWINERSHPRQKAGERIDLLYRQLTGQTVIPAHALEAKKQLIRKRRAACRNILSRILKRQDILEQIILASTYNSNRIEGSTLSENETAAILFQDAALPDKSLHEQIEAKNHRTALEYLFAHLDSGKGLTEELLLRLHSILMNSIRSDAGFYRRHGVRIVGSSVPTANYAKLPVLMEKLFQDIRAKTSDPIQSAAAIHGRFEQIHPFSDGNGRIGRLLMQGMLLASDLPPAVIRQSRRQLYIAYLNKAQTAGDIRLLDDLLCDAVLEGFDIVEGKTA